MACGKHNLLFCTQNNLYQKRSLQFCNAPFCFVFSSYCSLFHSYICSFPLFALPLRNCYISIPISFFFFYPYFLPAFLPYFKHNLPFSSCSNKLIIMIIPRILSKTIQKVTQKNKKETQKNIPLHNKKTFIQSSLLHILL